MGDNRETNVIDRWGFSHEVPNLGVIGASVTGTERGAQPDAHRASTGMAYRGLLDQELERNCERLSQIAEMFGG